MREREREIAKNTVHVENVLDFVGLLPSVEKVSAVATTDLDTINVENKCATNINVLTYGTMCSVNDLMCNVSCVFTVFNSPTQHFNM